MLISDWVCAAVEGKTVDGREITAQHIQQMADSYSQETYSARIWAEHIRGVVADGMFKALGDVIETKSAPVQGGALQGKLALYVRISPHPDLIKSVRNGQKVHLSIEMHPNFPATDGAYLMGLGVTDSPASMGTGVLKFSAAERADHCFSEFIESDVPLPPDESADLQTLKQQVKSLTTQFADIQKQLENQGGKLQQLRHDFEEQEIPTGAARDEVSGEGFNQEQSGYIPDFY